MFRPTPSISARNTPFPVRNPLMRLARAMTKYRIIILAFLLAPLAGTSVWRVSNFDIHPAEPQQKLPFYADLSTNREWQRLPPSRTIGGARRWWFLFTSRPHQTLQTSRYSARGALEIVRKIFLPRSHILTHSVCGESAPFWIPCAARTND